MSFTHFRLETDADGIALVTWDSPGRSMNVLNDEVIGEISGLVDAVVADPAIKGAVITSGKEGFSAGADLSMLGGMGARYAQDRQGAGRGSGDEGASTRACCGSTWCFASWRPAASRSPPRSTASAWAAASS